jgi:hypothetical protein
LRKVNDLTGRVSELTGQNAPIIALLQQQRQVGSPSPSSPAAQPAAANPQELLAGMHPDDQKLAVFLAKYVDQRVGAVEKPLNEVRDFYKNQRQAQAQAEGQRKLEALTVEFPVFKNPAFQTDAVLRLNAELERTPWMNPRDIAQQVQTHYDGVVAAIVSQAAQSAAGTSAAAQAATAAAAGTGGSGPVLVQGQAKSFSEARQRSGQIIQSAATGRG